MNFEFAETEYKGISEVTSSSEFRLGALCVRTLA